MAASHGIKHFWYLLAFLGEGTELTVERMWIPKGQRGTGGRRI